VLFGLLWLATGYDPIRSLGKALDTQAKLAQGHDRPYFPCAVFDLYDFFLGAGVIAFPILVFYFDRVLEHSAWLEPESILSLIGLATILVVDGTGLLRAETSRVWLFLQPLVALPVALALRSYTDRTQIVFFGVQWLTLVSLKAKLEFIRP
jgi:hypothetical protein